MSNKLTVGQTLFREFSFRDKPTEIKTFKIGNIGNKHFYEEGDTFKRYPISKDTLKYENKEYSQANFQLYLTEQEILDKREKYSILETLKKFFDWSGNAQKLSLEQLRQINQIINHEKQ